MKEQEEKSVPTLSASKPACTTGPNMDSVSLVSANISGIWSRRLEETWKQDTIIDMGPL